ncbi:MAG: Gfo/Idh/MocA family oxidoreductase [Myxococcota bacterium]
MTPLRIAVVGAGYMGSRHAERVVALAGEPPDRGDGAERVSLVGVADIDLSRARAAARPARAIATRDARELVALADAVLIAVPTLAHFEVALPWLDAGRDVLIEKPIAATVAQGERLVALAAERGAILHVGHLEWFNAGMRVVRERVDRPRFAEAHRMGPFPDRAMDVDVVRDLMIHDIEILQRLLGEEPATVDAIGVAVLSRDFDIANARLRFPSGCVANLTASRVSATPTRKLRFFQDEGYVAIDFLAQTAVAFRRELPSEEGATPKLSMERLATDRTDALALQLRSFVRAVRRRAPATVDAASGLAALRTAHRVRDAIRRGAAPTRRP